MKKILILLCGMLLGACSVGATPPVEPASASSETITMGDEWADVFATLIVDSLTSYRDPSNHTMSVDVAGPVGAAIEQELRLAGYGVNKDAPTLTYTVATYDHGRVYITAWLPTWQKSGVYAVTPAGELLVIGARSIRDDGPPVRADQVAVGRHITAPRRTALCNEVRIVPGSLRQNIDRELFECGYKLGEWRLGGDGYIDDWVITEAYTLTVGSGIRGVLRAIRNQYHIDSQIRPIAGRVDFHYPEEESDD